MKLSEQIKAAQDKRKAAIDAMEAMTVTLGEEGRSFSPDEQKSWDGHANIVKELDATIARFVELEASLAKSAKPAGTETEQRTVDTESGLPVGGTGPVIRLARPKVKGAFFARYAHALYKAGGNQMLAAQYASQEMGDKELGTLIKAAVNEATSSASGWAAELLQQEARDFIDLLRAASVYAAFPSGSTFTFDSTNSIRIPRQTTGTPGSFIAEGGAVPVAAGAFDSITLSPHKLGVITVATAEVLSRSTPALETILRDSMLRDTGTVLDRKFLSDAAAAGAAPAGLFHTSNAAAPIAPSATGTAVDDAIADITNIMNAHFAANSPLTNAVWMMHPQTKMKLMNLRNAVGAFYYRDEIRNGTLMGYPIMTSTLMDVTGNGGGSSAINDLALIDASMLSKANGMSPTISMSDTASVHMESAPNSDIGGAATPVRSLWQTDSVGLRLTYEVDYKMRHTASVQWVNAITW